LESRGVLSLSSLFDSVHNGMVGVDRAGIIAYFNPSAERIFRVGREEALGRSVLDVLPGIGQKLIECVETGTSFHGENLSDGEIHLVANVDPVFGDGEIVGAASIFHEFSEIERISGELDTYKKMAKQLDAIIESSYDGIWVCDGNGVTVRVNRAACELDDVRIEDVIGKRVKDLVENGLFDRSVTLEVLETKRPVTLIQELKGGRKALATGSPVFDEDGEILFVVINVRDITEIQRLTTLLEETRELSERYSSELRELKLLGFEEKNIVAHSEEMRRVLRTATRIARVDATVLLAGESGVGKNMIAELIHRLSDRKDGPFIQIACAAIPEPLLESELFGYEKGAFTGAKETGKAGLFELAGKGTLFLDEISEISLSVQVKLLRFLEDKQITRLGGTRPKSIDSRIIAASNRELKELVSRGLFREDLYYRLNTFPIHIPPLRERKSDVLPLIQFFLNRFNQKYGLKKTLSRDVLRALLDYSYPGNVRELSSLLENLVLISEGPRVETGDLPGYILEDRRSGELSLEADCSLQEMLERYESRIVEEAAKRYRSTRSIARALKTSHSSVVRRMQKYGIRKA